MSTTTVSRDVTLENIQRALSDALGPAYTVTATSYSTLKVRRFPLVTAEVNVKWDEDQTTLHAAPGEAWILQGINALTIYPKVRRALAQAFTPPPDGRTNPAPAAHSGHGPESTA